MSKQAWSATGAIEAQSAAHDRLQRAIANGSAVEIWMGESQLYTCANYAAAIAFIGKSRRYRIVPKMVQA